MSSDSAIDVVSVREEEPTTSYRKRKAYSLSKKLEVIEYAKKNSKTAAAKRYVWLDSSGGKCVAEKGSKEVSVLSTGHEKLRVTVMLTGRMDGYKCLPYVLLPRKRPDQAIVEMFKGKLILAWRGTNWMDDDATSYYLTRVLGQSLFGNFRKN
uniref:DDE-1 domain-containing protein n=1 Tax=Meloidogyne incognita TaxID=6306 RepID=A0A914L456_MELIC